MNPLDYRTQHDGSKGILISTKMEPGIEFQDTAFSLAAACGVARLLPSFANTPGADLKATLLPPPEPVDRYNAALQLYHFLAQAVASALTRRR